MKPEPRTKSFRLQKSSFPQSRPHSRLEVPAEKCGPLFIVLETDAPFRTVPADITIPKELREAAAVFRLNPVMRFRMLELPFAAVGLIWNSMVSWAGGWFFLMAAEIFTVGERDFRLPGLGAYLHEAANQGDLALTPLGETFAEASILARKEIFATRIRRLPIFRWLLGMLKAAENRRLQWDVVQKALELEFHPEEAERQLETAVNWGRYTESLAYEDNTGTIYLELGTET